MAFVSIVVPVHKVLPYLRTCLDSVLTQSYRDFELIVVDDASPDRCGEIVDEYAQLDERVRPVHLARNAGLGAARNTGLNLATGDYVWFVDSDDWLEPGALQLVVDRLELAKPDVLVVDYARAELDGSSRRNSQAYLLRQDAAPEVFAIEEHPGLLANFNVAWNKVCRADFLRDRQLSFPEGWYEDIAFTFPLLAAAGRISVLDAVCVHYRQRRSGSILRSRSARHREVIGQYELALARTANPLVTEHLKRFGVEHGLVVLGSPDRLPEWARRGFFFQLRDFALRHEVEPRGVKQRLLVSGQWRAYSLLGKAKRTAERARSAQRLWRQRPDGAVWRRLKALPYLGYYWLQRKRPLRDMAVFASYWGRPHRCSPEAIDRKLRELAPQVETVWVTEGTFAYYRALARARWAFNNVNFPDHVVKRPGQVHVQTHHGTPLKHMGVDEPGFQARQRDFGYRKLLKRCDRWDYSIVSNVYSTEIWGRAYPCDFESLEYGYPRNDVLVNTSAAEIARLRAELGFSPDETVVLYAPTIDSEPAEFTLPGVTLVRHDHYLRPDGLAPAAIEQLMLVADVLITDYSSVMFDFGVLDRPIVIYAADWESYQRKRGTYFDLLASPPGAVARTPAELRAVFDSGEVWRTGELRAAFRRKFCALDDGRAAERVVRKVILGEEVAW